MVLPVIRATYLQKLAYHQPHLVVIELPENEDLVDLTTVNGYFDCKQNGKGLKYTNSDTEFVRLLYEASACNPFCYTPKFCYNSAFITVS